MDRRVKKSYATAIKPRTGYSLEQKIVQLRRIPLPSRVVFTNGCFDILHPGHVKIIQYAAALAGPYGALVVGVNSDSSVRRYKGSDRPFVPIDERCFMIENIATNPVKYLVTIPFSEDTPLNLILAVEPDIIVKGGDYKPEDVVGHEYASIAIFPTVEGFSSTAIRGRINA